MANYCRVCGKDITGSGRLYICIACSTKTLQPLSEPVTQTPQTEQVDPFDALQQRLKV